MINCDALEWLTQRSFFFLELKRNLTNFKYIFPLPQNYIGQNHWTISEIVQKTSFLKATFWFRDTALLEKEVSFLFPWKIISNSSHPGCERPKFSSQEARDSLSINQNPCENPLSEPDGEWIFMCIFHFPVKEVVSNFKWIFLNFYSWSQQVYLYKIFI